MRRVLLLWVHKGGLAAKFAASGAGPVADPRRSVRRPERWASLSVLKLCVDCPESFGFGCDLLNKCNTIGLALKLSGRKAENMIISAGRRKILLIG